MRTISSLPPELTLLLFDNQEFFKTEAGRLFRLLTDKAKSHGLPADLVYIVRDRILISTAR